MGVLVTANKVNLKRSHQKKKKRWASLVGKTRPWEKTCPAMQET